MSITPWELPESWALVKLEDLCLDKKLGVKIGPFGSQLKKTELSESGTRVYGQENVITGDFSRGDRFVGPKKLESLKAFRLMPGDVLVTMMGTIGRVEVFPDDAEPGIMDSHLLRIRVDPRVADRFYLKHVLQSPQVIRQIVSQSRGIIMDGLNSKIVRALQIPLPPIKEQLRIVAKIDGSIDKVRTARDVVATQLKTLDELKDAVLERAFDGMLVEQDSNDEPVSALLERIRREREAACAGGEKCVKRI
jgi:type I restriction enzyme S subunit